MLKCSSDQCFCSNTYGINGNYLVNDTDCSMSCTGNSNQLCGGSNRNTIIKIEGTHINSLILLLPLINPRFSPLFP